MSSDPNLAATQILSDAHELRLSLNHLLETTPVVDMHTHLFPPQFGALNLWGIDELVTYHYLIAEYFRHSRRPADEFWTLDKPAQADAIWRTLFVENTPLSEATRGVVTVLSALGLDVRAPDLREARNFFRAQSGEEYVGRVLAQARVGAVVMTNDPFDARERTLWQAETKFDARFYAALRLDVLLNDWGTASAQLRADGYAATPEWNDGTAQHARRFLSDWIERMRPVYLAASLSDDFQFPDDSHRTQMLRDVVLPLCREYALPLSLMVGVRRAVNPRLRLAGDGVGRADVGALAALCAEYPDVKFLSSFLSRENQHELCVTARKFDNLMLFGCWWFLNNPSIITEITQERVELLGTSF
ncbi:MAG TPA: hypothetical protein VM870_02560, partial [Pyrinomonadaceae bacterium]|nr:hypothetical protein [Pyrinomonadaceae bacterium]